jgi:hypothetical protein
MNSYFGAAEYPNDQKQPQHNGAQSALGRCELITIRFSKKKNPQKQRFPQKMENTI